MEGLSRIVQQLGQQERCRVVRVICFCLMILLIGIFIICILKSSSENIIDFIMNATDYYNISQKNIRFI